MMNPTQDHPEQGDEHGAVAFLAPKQFQAAMAAIIDPIMTGFRILGRTVTEAILGQLSDGNCPV